VGSGRAARAAKTAARQMAAGSVRTKERRLRRAYSARGQDRQEAGWMTSNSSRRLLGSFRLPPPHDVYAPSPSLPLHAITYSSRSRLAALPGGGMKSRTRRRRALPPSRLPSLLLLSPLFPRLPSAGLQSQASHLASHLLGPTATGVEDADKVDLAI